MSAEAQAQAEHPGDAIRAGSILPARREAIELRTSDGLALVGEIAVPMTRPPAATLVCLHPLPTHGGMMDSHVLRKAAWRLPALAGIAVVRFNTRGTSSAAGTSEGSFDESRGEGLDLAAALAEVSHRGLPDPWLLGWSFGTDVALRHGNVEPVVGALLLSPPLRFTSPAELAAWASPGRPVVCLVPELDDYLRPDAARAAFATVPQAEIVVGEGAKHLWVGERYVRLVLDEIAERLVPGSAPLPTTWPAERARLEGPMETANDL